MASLYSENNWIIKFVEMEISSGRLQPSCIRTLAAAERKAKRERGRENKIWKREAKQNVHFYSSLAVIDFMIYLLLFHYLWMLGVSAPNRTQFNNAEALAADSA